MSYIKNIRSTIVQVKNIQNESYPKLSSSGRRLIESRRLSNKISEDS